MMKQSRFVNSCEISQEEIEQQWKIECNCFAIFKEEFGDQEN